jgi:hypothetical protein
LPAICEHPEIDPLHRALGDLLWPGGPDIPRPELGETTQAVYRSMYQQEPSPEEGLMFKTNWVRRYSAHNGEISLFREPEARRLRSASSRCAIAARSRWSTSHRRCRRKPTTS